MTLQQLLSKLNNFIILKYLIKYNLYGKTFYI